MIAAVIVLYNPDIKILEKNINSIKKQVDTLILSDNSTDAKIKNTVKNKWNDKTIYIDNNGNKGIAFGLNQGIRYCVKENIEWLLTLDQDSLSPDNLIDEYKKYISAENVGIISCGVNYNDCEIDKGDDKYNYINQSITSASLINTNICKKLGGYDEKMFIDLVDFEYCYRLRKESYKILQVNDVILNHHLGELELKKFPIKKIHVGNHSAFRKYYISRNTIYCYRKHKKYMTIFKLIYKLASLELKILFFEKNKIEKTKKVFAGIKDGIKMPITYDNWIR